MDTLEFSSREIANNCRSFHQHDIVKISTHDFRYQFVGHWGLAGIVFVHIDADRYS
jgi:hypothetical protein